MAVNRKLNRPMDQRKALLKGLVTSLFEHGRIKTTEARAKEIRSIAEKLISIAVKEADNFTSKQDLITKAKLDSKGAKITKSATSKNNRGYDIVDREEKTDMVTVDNPSRLHARRQAIKWLYRPKTKDGEKIKIANKLFDEIAQKYKEREGGYTRMYKIGPRRGDAAEMVILELVE